MRVESKQVCPTPVDTTAAEERTTAAKLWIVLVRAYRSVAEVLEAGIAGEGMCLSDFMVLEVLLNGSGESGGRLPMSVIGEKVQLANASMTSAVDRLHERGLVTREGATDDKRVRLVTLTDAGRAVITEVYRRHEIQIEELMEGLSGAERTELRRGLKQIGLHAKSMAAAQAKERKERQREAVNETRSDASGE